MQHTLRPRRPSAVRFRPAVEILENRLAPAAFLVRNTNDTGVDSLRTAVDAANAMGGTNIITFDSTIAGQSITLTSNNTFSISGVLGAAAFGPTALVVAPGNNLTIQGDTTLGNTIDGNGAASNHRVFGVFGGATLTLQYVTITGGISLGGDGGNGQQGGGGGAAGLGGAIFNAGTLNVIQSTLTGNLAQGGHGGLGTSYGTAGYGGGGSVGYNGGNGGGGGLTGGGGGVGGPGNSGALGGLGGANEFGVQAAAATAGSAGGGGGGNPGGTGGGGTSVSSGGIGGGGGGGTGTSGATRGGIGGFGSGSAGGGVGGFGGGFGGGAGGSNVPGPLPGGFGGGGSSGSSGGSLGGGGAGLGGAIFNNGGSVTLTNSTLAFNDTLAFGGSALGGAVFNRNGTLTILNSTLSGNTAAQGGRDVYNLGDGATATATITNSILGQTDAAITDFASTTIKGGSQSSGGSNNLIRNTTTFGGSSSTADPLLPAALANNGGPTHTLLPSSSSPALKAGTAVGAPTVDQRNLPRPTLAGFIDVGSVQISPAITSANTTNFLVGTAGTFTVTTISNPTAATITEAGALPAGVTFVNNGNGTATLAGTPAQSGTFTLTITASNGVSPNAVQTFTLVVKPAPIVGTPIFAVGADAGALPQINVYDAATGALKASLDAWPATFSGGVRVAVGDVTGDGVPDIVVGAGPGGLAKVKVYDGTNYQLVRDFFAFPSYFGGGVYVAAGDVNKDGFADVIVGAGQGGLSQVNVYSGKDSSVLTQFFAFPGFFGGGVRVAAGDVQGHGHSDIIVGTGPGGLAQVNVYDGATFNLLSSFFAYPNYGGGVFVAAGDVNADGKAEVITGPSDNLTPQVIIFNGNTGAPLNLFLAFTPSFQGGVRVAYAPTFGSSGKPAILTAAGPGATPAISAFDAATLTALNSFFALPQGFSGGLFVGG